jgi:hypothetical protein
MVDLNKIECWAQAALLFNGARGKPDDVLIELIRCKIATCDRVAALPIEDPIIEERVVTYQLLRTPEEVTVSYLRRTARSTAQLARGTHADNAKALATSVVWGAISAAALSEDCATVEAEQLVGVRLAVEVASACLRKADMVRASNAAEEEVLTLVGKLVQLGVAGMLEADSSEPITLIEDHHDAIARAIQGECKYLIAAPKLQKAFGKLLSWAPRNALLELPPNTRPAFGSQYAKGRPPLIAFLDNVSCTWALLYRAVFRLAFQVLLVLVLAIWPGLTYPQTDIVVAKNRRKPTLKTQLSLTPGLKTQQSLGAEPNQRKRQWTATHRRPSAAQLPEYVYLTNPAWRLLLYEASSYCLIASCLMLTPLADQSGDSKHVNTQWEWAIEGPLLYLSFATALGQLYEEISQLNREDVLSAPREALKRYLSDEFNFFDILGILAVSVVLGVRTLWEDAGLESVWLVYLSTIAVLMLSLGRMRVFYLSSTLGPFLVMVFKMLGDVLNIVMVSVPLMLSFAYAMQVLFRLLPHLSGTPLNCDKDSLESLEGDLRGMAAAGIPKALVVMTEMMMVGGDGDDLECLRQSRGGYFSWVIMMVYLLLSVVLLMNVIIAAMAKRCARVCQLGVRQFHAGTVQACQPSILLPDPSTPLPPPLLLRRTRPLRLAPPG